MVRKIRITLAALALPLITLLLLDFTGTLHHWLGWMARIQFMPALLSLNVAVLVALAVLTLLLGRVYCSVICPLGILQDVVSWWHRHRNKKHHFAFSREVAWLRYPVWALYAVAVALGIGSAIALLDPYGAFGRIATQLLQPLYLWGNNALAAIAAHYESYAFYGADVWLRSLPTLLIALGTLALVGVLAWRGGRTYCNTICPVGTTLSLLSRFALWRVRFDKDKCTSCGLCARSCKASCIDFKNHRVDLSRCVVCGNCLEKCHHDALHFKPAWAAGKEKTAGPEHPIAVDAGKRAFLVGGAIALSTAALAQAKKKRDGGLAVIEDKQPAQRNTPVLPPGALSARNMARHCVGCQLCVQQCPNQVLRPSTSPATLMQPVMSYERGYCRPECTRCSQVCPAGAITPITPDVKASTQIGHAVWTAHNCLPLTQKTEDGTAVACGNCARHCPTGAIKMVPFNDHPDAPLVPMVNASICIGCGACEHVCPSRPYSAIHVEGHDTHRII